MWCLQILGVKALRVGLIEKSFVPSEDLRELRDLTRLRKKRVGNLTADVEDKDPLY